MHELDRRGRPRMVSRPSVRLAEEDEGAPATVTPVLPAGPPTSVEPSVKPDDVAHHEWARRHDAVRDAAREFETLSPQDIRERFKGVTTKELDDQAVAQLEADVRAQQLTDLADALDQIEQGKLRTRRRVRLVMPRGYARFVMNRVTPEEYRQLEDRLVRRGWSPEQVQERLSRHVSTAKLAKLTSPE